LLFNKVLTSYQLRLTFINSKSIFFKELHQKIEYAHVNLKFATRINIYMLLIEKIRQNPELVKKGLLHKYFKNVEIVDTILSLDDEKKTIKFNIDNLLAERNTLSKNIGILIKENKKLEADIQKEKIAALKSQTETLESRLEKVEKELFDLLVTLPNLPHISVPEGKTPEENEVYFTVENLPQLPSSALPHWELVKKYDIIDFELGVKLTGAGFPVYKGKGALLQRALINFFLDEAISAGYQEIIPPHMVNEASAFATGQLPDKEGQMYHVTADNLYLIPTAEVPITNLYRDMIVDEKELPIKLTGYTPCFRREAGSYGKDVRGLNRLHQFDKIEIVQIAHPEKSYDILEQMLKHVENLLIKLELPYRILRLCGGDMTFSSALTFDFEVYSAAQKRWLEVSSVSNFETFQANRLKLRIKDEDNKKQLAHTLNGSAMALARIVGSIIENYQSEEGIIVPKVLQRYMGIEIIN
jgi:seryl-tRNA synthetase